jgi:hypothetical protein
VPPAEALWVLLVIGALQVVEPGPVVASKLSGVLVRLGWQDEEQQGRCAPMHGRRALEPSLDGLGLARSPAFEITDQGSKVNRSACATARLRHRPASHVAIAEAGSRSRGGSVEAWIIDDTGCRGT